MEKKSKKDVRVKKKERKKEIDAERHHKRRNKLE